MKKELLKFIKESTQKYFIVNIKTFTDREYRHVGATNVFDEYSLGGFINSIENKIKQEGEIFIEIERYKDVASFTLEKFKSSMKMKQIGKAAYNRMLEVGPTGNMKKIFEI